MWRLIGRSPIAHPPGTEDQDRRAHGLDEVVRRLERPHRAEPHGGRPVPGVRNLRAELLEHAQHGAHVAHAREVRQRDRLVGQEGRRQGRQRGVLGTADRDAPPERAAADDSQLVHGGRGS
jgi:hypothetical protein